MSKNISDCLKLPTVSEAVTHIDVGFLNNVKLASDRSAFLEQGTPREGEVRASAC